MTFVGFSMWSFSDAIIRHLKDNPTIHVAFIAGLGAIITVIVCAPLLGGFRDTIFLPKLRLRLLRGVILSFSNLMAFITFANLEMAPAYAIIFIIPVAAKILSVVMMKESISARSWFISGLGFLGVLIVVRPGMVPMGIGSIAAFLLVLGFSIGQVMTRWIGKEHQTLMSMAGFQYALTAIMLGLYIIMRGEVIQMSVIDMAWSGLIGALCIFGALLVSNAYACHPAAHIAPVQYTQMLWGISLGALLFGEYPDMWTLVGAAVIIVSGLLLLRSSARAKKRTDKIAIKPL